MFLKAHKPRFLTKLNAGYKLEQGPTSYMLRHFLIVGHKDVMEAGKGNIFFHCLDEERCNI